MNEMTPQKRKIVLVVGVVVFVLLVVILSLIIKKSADQLQVNVGDGPGAEIAEDSLIFNGRKYLSEVMSDTASAKILTIVENHVLSDAEKNTAPRRNRPSAGRANNYYDGVITDVTPVQELFGEHGLAVFPYNFKLSVSDGREYYVYTMADAWSIYEPPGQRYTAALFTRTDTERKPFLNVVRIQDDSRVDSEVSAWLKIIGFERNNLSVKDEYSYDYDSDGRFRSVIGRRLNYLPGGFYSVSTPSSLITINNENTPRLVSGNDLPQPKIGDRVKLYYACPSNGSTGDCLVYKYNIYD